MVDLDIYLLILVITGFGIVWQVREMRNSSIVQAYRTVFSILQQEEIRQARGKLMGKTTKKLFNIENIHLDALNNGQIPSEITNRLNKNGLPLPNQVQILEENEVYFLLVEKKPKYLIENTKTGIRVSSTDYGEWNEEDRRSAEKVTSTYDAVGMLVNSRVFHSKFIVNHYHDSIIKCWNNSKSMIYDYRYGKPPRGKDYWDDFQILCINAKKYKPSKKRLPLP